MSCFTLQIRDDIFLEIDEEIVLFVEASSELVKISAERAQINIIIENDDSKW